MAGPLPGHFMVVARGHKANCDGMSSMSNGIRHGFTFTGIDRVCCRKMWLRFEIFLLTKISRYLTHKYVTRRKQLVHVGNGNNSPSLTMMIYMCILSGIFAIWYIFKYSNSSSLSSVTTTSFNVHDVTRTGYSPHPCKYINSMCRRQTRKGYCQLTYEHVVCSPVPLQNVNPALCLSHIQPRPPYDFYHPYDFLPVRPSEAPVGILRRCCSRGHIRLRAPYGLTWLYTYGLIE